MRTVDERSDVEDAVTPFARTEGEDPEWVALGEPRSEPESPAIETVPEGPPTVEDAPLRSTVDDLPTAVARAVGVVLAAGAIAVGIALRRGRN